MWASTPDEHVMAIKVDRRANYFKGDGRSCLVGR